MAKLILVIDDYQLTPSLQRLCLNPLKMECFECNLTTPHYCGLLKDLSLCLVIVVLCPKWGCPLQLSIGLLYTLSLYIGTERIVYRYLQVCT